MGVAAAHRSSLTVREGYLFVTQAARRPASRGSAATSHLGVLGPWVGERLRVAVQEAETVATRTVEGASDPNRLDLGDTVFRFTRLLAPTASGQRRDELVGAVVLSGDKTVPFSVGRTIAERLRSTVQSVGVAGETPAAALADGLDEIAHPALVRDVAES